MNLLAEAAVRAYGMAARFLPLQREPFRSLYSLGYFAYKRLEDPFAVFLRSHSDLLRNGHVIDAGANIGYTTLLFASYVEPPFSVHAFEPEALNFELLRRNVMRSPIADRIVLHRAALGARNGQAVLAVSRAHPGDHRIVTDPARATGDRTLVDLVAIDDAMAGQPVSFVKMDVQGFEQEVARGMTGTIARNPRIAVAFEFAPAAIEDLGFDRAHLLRFFEERGFVFAVIDRATLRNTTAAALLEGVRGRHYVNVLCRRPE
jgi:FkbM family methyltransferase